MVNFQVNLYHQNLSLPDLGDASLRSWMHSIFLHTPGGFGMNGSSLLFGMKQLLHTVLPQNLQWWRVIVPGIVHCRQLEQVHSRANSHLDFVIISPIICHLRQPYRTKKFPVHLKQQEWMFERAMKDHRKVCDQILFYFILFYMGLVGFTDIKKTNSCRSFSQYFYGKRNRNLRIW